MSVGVLGLFVMVRLEFSSHVSIFCVLSKHIASEVLRPQE